MKRDQLDKSLGIRNELPQGGKKSDQVFVENGTKEEEGLNASILTQSDKASMPMIKHYQHLSSLKEFTSNKDIRRYIRTLSFFVEIGALMCENPDINNLLSIIAKDSPSIMEADRSTIFILDKDEKVLWSYIALGLNGQKIHFDKNLGIAGHVLKSAKMLNITNVDECPYFNKEIDKKTGYLTKTVLCAPLINSENKAFGVFQVLNKNKGVFTKEDELLIQILSSQISIVFENIVSRNELTTLKENLIKENIYLRKQVQKQHDFAQIVGMNYKLIKVLETVKQAARFNIPVTIEGESGTGKELIANAIHFNSERAQGPFICINCSAIPRDLLEAELFGFEKGAFTCAYSPKKGLLEEANNGTLFLDEIGDMEPRLQVTILRFLQTGEVQRLGSTNKKFVDVRIITATNKNLSRLVENGLFREDLFYRINVINLYIPPLRERKDDIPLLIRHFLEKFCPLLNKKIKGVTAEVEKLLLRYDFPGNIRELENIIKRAIVISDGEWITCDYLPHSLLLKLTGQDGPQGDDSTPYIPKNYSQFKEIKAKEKKRLEEKFDKKFLVKILREHKGNISSAARGAKMNRSYLHQMILKCNLDLKSFR